VEKLISYIIVGLANGCIYSLVAIGFVIIFKSSGIINFSHGAIMLLSAYVYYLFSFQFGLPLAVAILFTLAFGALLGFSIERVLLDRLIGQSVLMIITLTLAIAELFRGVMHLGWGNDILSAPPLFPKGNIHLLKIVMLDYSRVAFLILTFLLIVVLAVLYNKTTIGLAMKATSDDTVAAESVGIKIRKVFAATWVISCLTAAIGGILVTNVMGIHFQVAEIGFKAMVVALVGGMESLPGMIVIGPLMGIIEFLASGYLDEHVGGGMRDLAPFIILLFVLVVKPYGVFGWKRIERV
jgi:branched-chain amino acid transport system permease protein